MQRLETIIVIDDREAAVTALAVAQVLSARFGMNQLILKSVQHRPELPSDSLLLLVETQIEALSVLRQYGFCGAVVVLSTQPFESLHKKHKILTYGISSHTAWESPWETTLPDLFEKVPKLKPLRSGNQRILKKDLQAAVQRLDLSLESLVLPYLEQLHGSSSNFEHKLGIFKQAIEDLWEQTPSARHGSLKLDGYGEAQIQKHFQRLLDEIQDSQSCNDRQMMLLRQLLEQWRNLVKELGEDIRAFSEERDYG